MHRDPGRRYQRVDHLALDGQVDFGGEVVTPFADRGVRPVTGDERLRGRRHGKRPGEYGGSVARARVAGDKKDQSDLVGGTYLALLTGEGFASDNAPWSGGCSSVG